MVTKIEKGEDAGGIMSRALCLSVSFGRWGVSRKTDAPIDDEKTKADQTMLRTSKRLAEAPEIDAVVRCDGDLKRWLAARCVPFPLQKGVFLVPVAALQQVKERIDAVRAQREQLVERLVAAMPAIKERAAERLSDLYDATQYPEGDALSGCYQLRTAFVSFDVPGMLKELDDNLFNDEKARAQLEWRQASDEIRGAMREAFARLVSHLTERLTGDGPGERPKVFRDSAVENLREFIDAFALRNLTDDSDLARLVEQARAITDGVDVKTLRKNETVKARVAEEMGRVLEATSAMLVNRPSRRIVLSDD